MILIGILLILIKNPYYEPKSPVSITAVNSPVILHNPKS
jgi:hypothetical protein